jgi:N-acetylmuramoyl-L-alanine amidase
LLGGQLQERGLKYTPHYTDPIMGNRKRRLVDAHAGVYRYDQLIVLRTTGMPAVLLEAGSIINREEELRMASAEHQALTSAAAANAVTAFCKTHQPRLRGMGRAEPARFRGKTTAPTAVTPVQQSGSAGLSD